MNRDEQVAETYLKSLGIGIPEFEPDGNIPPDFSIGKDIGIEVRRLNKNIFEDGKAVGLEEAEYPLIKTVQSVTDEFQGSNFGCSFFVFVRFNRPIPKKKAIQTALRNEFKAYLAGPLEIKREIKVTKNLTIDIYPASRDFGTIFRMGGTSDEQRGGWLLDDLEVNIQYSSDEKERKILPYRKSYRHWWLVLVDHIGYALDELDRDYFERDVSIVHGWDKLVLVDPRDGNRAYEI